MSDETGNGVFVLHSVSGCYAEVHISWENLYKHSFPLTAPSVPILFKFCHYSVFFILRWTADFFIILQKTILLWLLVYCYQTPQSTHHYDHLRGILSCLFRG